MRRSSATTPFRFGGARRDNRSPTFLSLIQWKQGPVPGVCTTPLVGGQWQDTGGKDLELRIVTNKGAANIPVNGTMRAL